MLLFLPVSTYLCPVSTYWLEITSYLRASLDFLVFKSPPQRALDVDVLQDVVQSRGRGVMRGLTVTWRDALSRGWWKHKAKVPQWAIRFGCMCMHACVIPGSVHVVSTSLKWLIKTSGLWPVNLPGHKPALSWFQLIFEAYNIFFFKNSRFCTIVTFDNHTVYRGIEARHISRYKLQNWQAWRTHVVFYQVHFFFFFAQSNNKTFVVDLVIILSKFQWVEGTLVEIGT